MSRRSHAFLLAVVTGLLLAGANVAHAGPPDGFALRTIVKGLASPTSFAFAPDGRVFVTDKSGLVYVFSQGRRELFLDLRSDVNRYSDRGLLSIALDPAFEQNRRLYLLFTEELRPDDPDAGHPAGGKLIRIEVSSSDPNAADVSSRTTLVSGFRSIGPWHSVGGLDFDRDGRLLVGFGDGSPYCTTPKCQRTGVVEPYKASAYAPYDLDSLSGKILRIDPETGLGVPENPFFDPDAPGSVASLVLARGVRTPFRVQADRTTGEVFIGDVGTDQWEEINVIPASWGDPRTELNFGWPCYEGSDEAPQATRPGDPYCESNFYGADSPGTAVPRYAYAVEQGAALIMGPRYRGSTYPDEYDGVLFAGDWKRDALSTISDDGLEPFGTDGDWGQPVDVDVTPAGNLAYLAISTGRLNEVIYTRATDAGDDRSPPVVWIVLIAACGGLLVAAYAVQRRRTAGSR